jgi:hypothetical protein
LVSLEVFALSRIFVETAACFVLLCPSVAFSLSEVTGPRVSVIGQLQRWKFLSSDWSI